jgi:uncharacterized lipoprotein YbaY
MNKAFPLVFLAAFLALFAAAGCSHIEVVPEGDPHRVVNGTVEVRTEMPLPADAVVVVRVIDQAGTEQARLAAGKDLPLGDRAKVTPAPQVLAEQTISGVQGNSVPFHLEFTADDELMRHGLNIEARISFAGKVRFRTAIAHALTLGNVDAAHQVFVELASR